MKKRSISLITFLGLIPLSVVLGFTVFSSVKYVYIILIMTVLSAFPFFIRFEKKEHELACLLLIAAMTAMSISGRILFSFVPAFKPVTAMVVLTAVYFGADAGFMTGALSALLSNFFFGQGPWTVLQMAAWGFLGFFAGILSERLKKSLPSLLIYGAVSGVAYSLILDVWYAVFADGVFSAERYFAAVASSGFFTVMYAVSNVIFLLVLQKPIGGTLQRMKEKYGI